MKIERHLDEVKAKEWESMVAIATRNIGQKQCYPEYEATTYIHERMEMMNKVLDWLFVRVKVDHHGSVYLARGEGVEFQEPQESFRNIEKLIKATEVDKLKLYSSAHSIA